MPSTPDVHGGPAAGRDLDALIAERLFGAEWRPMGEHVERLRWTESSRLYIASRSLTTGQLTESSGLREYSTHITAAWSVIEKLMETCFAVNIHVNHESACTCTITGPTDVQAEAPNAPLAICRAALAVLEQR